MKKLRSLPSFRFLELFFALVSLSLLVAAFLMPDRKLLFDGLWKIMTSTCVSPSNLFDLGGFAATFFNAGLVGLVCTILFLLPRVEADSTSVVAFLLTVGFGFWSIHLFNIWFGFAGVALYCLVKKEALGKHINTMLFTTGLTPLFSELLLRYPHGEAGGFTWGGVALALGVGLTVGFFLPAGLAYSPNVHKSYNHYSAAVPVGMAAFFLRALLYQVLGGTLPPTDGTSPDVASRGAVNLFCFALFNLCILFAFLLGCKPKDYWNLMKDHGHRSDFAQKYSNAAFLMNAGVYGLFILAYYNLVGATFNAVTMGCIFCMLACCNSGSHPGNVWPIMLGYVAASFLFRWLSVGEYTQAINAQAIVVGLCFASGLSPIAGKYGWYFGIPAGILHFILVTSVPLLHGSLCLYNGGLTAAFICLLFVPVLERFFKTKEERRAIKTAKSGSPAI